MDQFNTPWRVTAAAIYTTPTDSRVYGTLDIDVTDAKRFLDEKRGAGVKITKTHLATALALEACRHNHSVLFTSAVDIINTLAEARAENRLRRAIRRYVAPAVLAIDELGYLPVDRVGAELLFQVLGERYEKGSTIITTNRSYKDWGKTFANDATLASAVLDRVIHHCETVIIEGKSYRLKDRVNQDALIGTE